MLKSLIVPSLTQITAIWGVKERKSTFSFLKKSRALEYQKTCNFGRQAASCASLMSWKGLLCLNQVVWLRYGGHPPGINLSKFLANVVNQILCLISDQNVIKWKIIVYSLRNESISILSASLSHSLSKYSSEPRKVLGNCTSRNKEFPIYKPTAEKIYFTPDPNY